VDEVIVYCVNDGAVMQGWEKDQGVKRGSSGQFFYKGQPSMVTFMADTRSELTQALDMVLDDPGVMGALGNPRCKRFALVRTPTLRACRHARAHSESHPPPCPWQPAPAGATDPLTLSTFSSYRCALLRRAWLLGRGCTTDGR
jgi:hypothetical protein